MPINQSDIKFYLTHIDYDQAQPDVHRSLGGFVSSSEVSPIALASNNIDAISSTAFLQGGATISGSDYLLINGEVAALSESGPSYAILSNRGSLDTNKRFVHSGSPIYGISSNSFFSPRFGGGRTQYRCIAIKNTHATDSAYSMQVYLKYVSRNNSCSVNIAVESPQADYMASIATGGSTVTLIDTSLGETYQDNHFSGCVLRILSGDNNGQVAKVASYDSETNTFVLATELPIDIINGVSYSVDPTPCTRTASSLIAPTGDRISDFVAASSVSEAISINVFERDHGADLLPNDVIYIWLERTLDANAASFDDNRVVLAIRYGNS